MAAASVKWMLKTVPDDVSFLPLGATAHRRDHGGAQWLHQPVLAVWGPSASRGAWAAADGGVWLQVVTASLAHSFPWPPITAIRLTFTPSPPR